MRQATIGYTGVETTVVGFGCADLFRQPTSRRRSRLLDAALDAGIRHLDVAPMYGLGRAEAEVGRLLRRRHEDVVVATKFGIEPTALASAIAPIQGPLQRIRGRGPAGADPRAGRLGSALYDAPGFTAASARRSLERSLQALQRDHVDLLFLHDPEPGSGLSDDVRAFLEDARDRGVIRGWGIAGEPDALVALDAPVVQVRRDILDSGSLDADIVFGVLGRALPRLSAHLRDPEAAKRWSDALGLDVRAAGVLPRLLVQSALTEGAVVLVSSVDPARVAALAAAGRNGTNRAAVETLERLVRDEIGGST